MKKDDLVAGSILMSFIAGLMTGILLIIKNIILYYIMGYYILTIGETIILANMMIILFFLIDKELNYQGSKRYFNLSK